jgi:hypothetical protein
MPESSLVLWFLPKRGRCCEMLRRVRCAVPDFKCGNHRVTDLESVLRKIEYWHHGSIAKFNLMCRDGKGSWHGVRWDGKTASLIALEKTDERKARKKLLERK